MSEYLMPSLGADMQDATLVEWYVKPGDQVKRGDIIADLETEKGDIDVEVYEDGFISKLIAKPGQKLPVGSVLAIIDGKNGPTESIENTPNGPLQKVDYKPENSKKLKISSVKASPLARKMAEAYGLELKDIAGTGPGGAIQKADVEKIHQLTEKQVATDRVITSKATNSQSPNIRNAISAAMTRSNRDIPHYYLDLAIDVHPALQWLEAENQKRSVQERLLPVAMVIKAVALALTEVPELNAYYKDDQLVVNESINIGFAISLRQGGLVTPAILNADLKSLGELMLTLTDLVKRVRGGRLRMAELSEGTITLTNLGDLGVDNVMGVIYPPQVALIGVGKINEKAWAENGMLTVRPVVKISLAADHRASDGARGAKFLNLIKKYLQNPEKL